MKVVVTGGAGFIGANLCRELALRPGVRRVVAMDDLSTGSAANLAGQSTELVSASILDRTALNEVVAGADAVIHLAARPSVSRSVQDPVSSHDANVTGTVYVLEACRTAGARLVAASSSSVYGDAAVLPKHEDLPTRPRSPYAASKLAGEAYVLAYGATYGLPTLAFRFFNVYGPLQSAGHAYAAVVPTFIDAALRGVPLPMHGDGTQTRDFTFVGSVVRVLADAALRGVHSSSPVNLAFGSRISILGLVAKLEAMLGRAVDIAWQPTRVGDVRDSQAADGRLRELFPDLTPASLDHGLARTLDWFRSLPQFAGATVPAPAAPTPAAAPEPTAVPDPTAVPAPALVGTMAAVAPATTP